MMYKSGAWDLSEIDPKSISEGMEIVERRISELEMVRKRLRDDIEPREFLKLLGEFEEVQAAIDRIGTFCHLRFCENASNQQAVADRSRFEQQAAQWAGRLMFFSLWFKGIGEDRAEKIIGNSGKYRYYLERMRATARYTLSEPEERVVNIKDPNGIGALNNVYNIFTSKFEYKWGTNRISQEELMVHVRDCRASVRERAYRTLIAKYREHREVIGEIYKSIINDWRAENCFLRKYKSPIGVRNVGNDVPDKAVEALLKVCRDKEKLLARFFALKAKRLRLKRIRRFDLYAPMGQERKNISYDSAVRMVIDSYGGFHREFANRAKEIISAGHVHSMMAKGKRSGAFCCGAGTRILPFVMLSFNGTARSVATLAHELGHGVHFSLASCQSEYTMDASLPMAETASIFGEMLLSETLQQKDPEAFESLVWDKLDDLYASIIRQAGFVRFEIEAHESVKKGATIDEISNLYLNMLREQLGEGIEVDDIFAYEWLYIPHIFHTPFYCYAYAFGNLLTLALYEMYREDARVAEKIVAMLKKGGSEEPVKMAGEVGADICSEKFWEKGFEVIERMIEGLEKNMVGFCRQGT